MGTNWSNQCLSILMKRHQSANTFTIASNWIIVSNINAVILAILASKNHHFEVFLIQGIKNICQQQFKPIFEFNYTASSIATKLKLAMLFRVYYNSMKYVKAAEILTMLAC